jgi:hypothetical protein
MLAQSRNKERHSIRSFDDRAHVLVPNRVKSVWPDHALVGRNSDNWTFG